MCITDAVQTKMTELWHFLCNFKLLKTMFAKTRANIKNKRRPALHHVRALSKRSKSTREASFERSVLPCQAVWAVMQRCCGKITSHLRLSSTLLFLTLCFAPVMLHPQCLDFKPPFRPRKELEFCIMYKEFGCCDYQKDQELMSKYYQIMDHFDYSGYASCAGFIFDLLCQVGTRGQRSVGWVQDLPLHTQLLWNKQQRQNSKAVQCL